MPQAKSSLAERLRELLDEAGMQQQEFADLLGVNLGRAKSLLLGRVKSLTFEETQRLVAAFDVTAVWLNSGRPPRSASAPPIAPLAASRVEPRGGSSGWVPGAGKAVVLTASEPASPPPTAEPAAAHLARGPYAPPLEDRLLARAIEVVERALSARRVTLEAARRARLIGALYEMSVKTGLVNLEAVEPLLAEALFDSQGE